MHLGAVHPGSPVQPCPTARYLEKAGGHRVSAEHGAVQGHPLADQPQDLLPLVADVGAVLLLAASRGLHVEGGHQSREPQRPTGLPTTPWAKEGQDTQGPLTSWAWHEAGTSEGLTQPCYEQFLLPALHTILVILRLEGYWCRRAAQSWALGMKTLWVRRKSLRNVSVGQGCGDRRGFRGQVH